MMETPKLKKKLAKDEVLVLRTCNPDGTSYNGFQWPKIGLATCPDWKPIADCGNGLHGLLWGIGGGSYLDWGEAAWLVVRVKAAEIVDIESKVKFPSGIVEYFGDRVGAVALISAYAPVGSAIVGGTATAGDRGAIAILYWNGWKYRRACFEVGENDIKPNTPYRVGEDGKAIEVTA